MGDCLYLWTGKPSRDIIITNINSVFHPSGVRKSSKSSTGHTYLPAWLILKRVAFICHADDDTVRSYMAGDTP